MKSSIRARTSGTVLSEDDMFTDKLLALMSTQAAAYSAMKSLADDVEHARKVKIAQSELVERRKHEAASYLRRYKSPDTATVKQIVAESSKLELLTKSYESLVARRSLEAKRYSSASELLRRIKEALRKLNIRPILLDDIS